MKTVNAAIVVVGALLAIMGLVNLLNAVSEILFNLQADPVSISRSLHMACWSAIGAASVGLVGGILVIVRRGRHVRSSFCRLGHGH